MLQINSRMKQRKTAVAAVASLAALIISLGALAAGAQAAEVRLELSFHPDELSLHELHGYQVVSLKGCLLPEGAAGAPWLPVKYVNVLLPSGARATAVRITADEVLVKEGIRVCPLQPPQPLSKPKRRFIHADRKAYAEKAKTPRRRAALRATRKLRGYHFVSVRLNPVRYAPAGKKLYLATKMRVTVIYRRAKAARRAPRRNRGRFKRMVSQLVANPEAPGAEPEQNATGGTQIQPLGDPPAGGVDYLLITNTALAPAFQSLVDRRLGQGLGAALVTTESIYAAYPGADKQEKIRNCIIDYYQNQGTVYVALGGDNTIMPDRDCYVSCGPYVEARMPTDLYYGALDGTWDLDGDGVYGEAGQDGVDLLPEVFVGRIPVRTATDATNYISKVVVYEAASPNSFSGQMLLVGSKLWNRYSGGSRPSDFFDHDPVSDTYIWTFRMYRDSVHPSWQPTLLDRFFDTRTSWDAASHGDHVLTAANLAARLSDGYHHMFIATHASTTTWAVESGASFSTASALTLANAGRPTIFYTVACDTGGFDRAEPSLSEAFLRQADGGAIAYIGCSRFGWGLPGSYEGGPSFDYARAFYAESFGNGRNVLGEAFAYQKMAMAPQSGSNSAYRWVQFGLNLQGDPAIRLLDAEAGRTLQIDTPNGLEVYNRADTIAIRWNAGGAGWQTGDQVRLEASDDGGATWQPMAGAESLEHDAANFQWMPSIDNFGPSDACRIRVTYAEDDQVTDDSDRNFAVTGVAIITESPLPSAQAGEAYSLTLQAVGTGPFTWSGGPLPSGLSLNASTGEISGTPAEGGTFTFSIQVTDGGNPQQVAAKLFDLSVVGAGMAVTDSILPEDDLGMPFAPVTVGESRTEHVTITNTGTTETLEITDLRLSALREDFNDDVAQAWQEDVDADWAIQGQEYLAYQASPTGPTSMVATYSGQEWSDCYVEVKVRKTALTDPSAQYLLVRASADFERHPIAAGNGYAFGYDAQRYYIYKIVNGTFTRLQTWISTSDLNPDDQGNTLGVNVLGTTLQFFVNGKLAWTGTDSSIAAGRIGLLGYTDPAYVTTHYFDDVTVTTALPLAAEVTAGPAKGNRPLSRGNLDPTRARRDTRPTKRRAKARAAASGGIPIGRLATSLASAFTLSNVPPLPLTLTPGQSVTFDVVLSPTFEGPYQDTLTIANSAGNVVLGLTGSGVAGAEIRGVNWSDDDGNGVRDPGESSLENWTVYLDENDNGQLDAGEPSTTTDANGDYAFTGLAPGAYIVAEVVEAGWDQTWPPGGGTHTVTVTSGEVAPARDFGNRRQNPPEARDLAITPDPAGPDDDLIGIGSYYDADGDPLQGLEIRWYRQGVHESAWDGQMAIPAAETDSGDEWYFEVRVFDGTDWSDWAQSLTAVIQGPTPRVEALGLFYQGRFNNAADPDKQFLALGQVSQMWLVGDDLHGNVTNCVQGITGIRVAFDTVVTFAGGVSAAFSYQATGEQSSGKTFLPFIPPTGPSYAVDDSAGKTVVTITFTEGEIKNQWLKTIIDASQVSANGLNLDGELAAPLALPSGDGEAGGNAEFIIGNRVGDVDANYRTSVNDALLLRAHVSGSVVSISNVYDIDKSGRALFNDAFAAWRAASSTALPVLP